MNNYNKTKFIKNKTSWKNSKVRKENLLINIAISRAEYSELSNIYYTVRNLSDKHISQLVGLAGKIAALEIELELFEQNEKIDKLKQDQKKDNLSNKIEVKTDKRAIEQNNRMRKWFKSRSGLDSTLLFEHMVEIDRLLSK